MRRWFWSLVFFGLILIICLVVCYFFSSRTLLDSLSEKGVDVDEDEECFRFLIIRDDGVYFITRNVSYTWMVENGLIRDGWLSKSNYNVAFIVRTFCPQLIYPAPWFGSSATGFEIQLQTKY